MTNHPTHLVERAVAFLRSDAGLIGDAEATPVAVPPSHAPVQATTPMVADGLDSMAREIVTPPAASPVPAAARVDLDTMLRAGLSVAGHDRSRIVEEYRVTVDRLLRGLRAARNGTDRTNLMLVTSARPGEGKTFTALNLAASIVRNGLGEALLVDMDTKPLSLTWQFGLTDASGLLNLVANPSLRVDDLLLKTAVEGLLYLPIGTRGLPGAETDVIRPINAALERVVRRFPRHIVVADCPPCLSSSDPVTLAPLADQIVLVVEAERTQRGEIESALELIRACPNVTLMLNKLQLTTSSTFGAYYGTLKP
jgi:receptor protein-tyrosine kinase